MKALITDLRAAARQLTEIAARLESEEEDVSTPSNARKGDIIRMAKEIAAKRRQRLLSKAKTNGR